MLPFYSWHLFLHVVRIQMWWVLSAQKALVTLQSDAVKLQGVSALFASELSVDIRDARRRSRFLLTDCSAVRHGDVSLHQLQTSDEMKRTACCKGQYSLLAPQISNLSTQKLKKVPKHTVHTNAHRRCAMLVPNFSL